MSENNSSERSQSDLARLDQMRDEDIDFSDLPEVPPEKFARAIVREGLKPVRQKVQLTIRLDADIVDWFRSRGKGYQTRINQVLKAYVEAHGV